MPLGSWNGQKGNNETRLCFSWRWPWMGMKTLTRPFGTGNYSSSQCKWVAVRTAGCLACFSPAFVVLEPRLQPSVTAAHESFIQIWTRHLTVPLLLFPKQPLGLLNWWGQSFPCSPKKNDLMWNKVDFSHRPPSEACRTGGFIFDPACCPFGRKTISRNADAMTGTENDSRAFFGPILIFAHVLTGTIKKEGLQTVLQSSTSRRYVWVFFFVFFFAHLV